MEQNLKHKKDDSTHSTKNGANWKEWKIKKKEEYRKWKQEKLIKKKQKLDKTIVKDPKDPSSSASNPKETGDFTISIAVPGSILDNAQSPELKTYLAGQIARAAVIFNVNEVIVYNETVLPNLATDDSMSLKLNKKNRGSVQMVRLLQYLECPQYLRKYYFPIHKDFEYAGLLNPLDIPHHLRTDEESEYREGIVLNKPVKEGRGSYVYIGLARTAIIDKILEPNIRVTVQLDKEGMTRKHYKGKAVSPTAPFKSANLYWGYTVRHANSLNAVFSESTFKGGYDLTIGTSDKGDSVDSFHLPSFKHLLIVFGGLKGIETCLEDETIDAHDPKEIFKYYLNTCPQQGSRTIRTEEAVIITLSSLRPRIQALYKNTV